MRYLLAIALAFFLIGNAFADAIPTATLPKDEPSIWTQDVYNNDTVALTSGTAVVWAMSADTADTSFAYRTMWVDQTTTQNDINSAGIVVSDTIAAGAGGTIAIYGPVYALCADATEALVADEVCGTSTVEGQLDLGASADNTAVMGWCILASPVAETLGGHGGTDGNDHIMLPVFVNVSLMQEGAN